MQGKRRLKGLKLTISWRLPVTAGNYYTGYALLILNGLVLLSAPEKCVCVWGEEENHTRNGPCKYALVKISLTPFL